MDQSAIQEIANLSAAQTAGNVIAQNGMAAIVIPGNYKLEPIEHLNPLPTQFRGKFKTTVLAQFIRYIDQNGSADTGVFIDQDSMSAAAIIDMETKDFPQWGKHIAGVAIKKTPTYGALLSFADQCLNQQAFIDFAEDCQDHIAFYYGDHQPTADPFKATIKTLRKLKTAATATTENEVGNFNASRSAMETIEITAGAEQPPAGFLFTVVPHDGFDAIKFDCQLRAITEGKEVKLKYRIVQLEQHKEQIAEQFREKIISGIKTDEISIFIGEMAYQ